MTNDPATRFGWMMAATGLSDAALAEWLGCNPDAPRKWRAGKSRVPPGVLDELGELLGEMAERMDRIQAAGRQAAEAIAAEPFDLPGGDPVSMPQACRAVILGWVEVIVPVDADDPNRPNPWGGHD